MENSPLLACYIHDLEVWNGLPAISLPRPRVLRLLDKWVVASPKRLWGTGIFTTEILWFAVLSFVAVNSQTKHRIFLNKQESPPSLLEI